jgi:hypothetical protein
MMGDFRNIREILLDLFHRQRSLTNNQKLPEYDRMFQDFPPMDSDEKIRNLMDEKKGLITDFCNSNEFLYLPPLDQDPKVVPILLFDCDLTKTINDVTFVIVLFRFMDGSDTHESIAFRFEGPEGTNVDKSRHNYWHMQVTNKITGRKGYQKHICQKWLPDKMPCIPIISQGPVSLLLCMLYSFYGMRMFEYIRSDTMNTLEKRHFESLKPILAGCC